MVPRSIPILVLLLWAGAHRRSMFVFWGVNVHLNSMCVGVDHKTSKLYMCCSDLLARANLPKKSTMIAVGQHRSS